uniref:DNA polymerase III subunit delta n=1 Tax=Candidatus Aschnera chinzeii TaxID=1485666 RepID=A0AAT9G4G2_9ENTR|nr:MAG: hypothetical protein ACHINZ_2920 [Candidatus Aschnera chinzeii]
MIYLHPEEIKLHLSKNLLLKYFIFGSDYFIIQNSIEQICQIAKKYNFHEVKRFDIEINTNWNVIYSYITSYSIFSNHQIIILTLSENINFKNISQNLLKINKLLHNKLLFILVGKKFHQAYKQSLWYREIKKNSVYIHAITPKNKKLVTWIIQKAQDLSINLDHDVVKFFCYFYAKNLFIIHQALIQISLIYYNKKIFLSNILHIINEISIFTPYQFIQTLFLGKQEHFWYILQEMKNNDNQILLLIFLIQHELKILLTLKMNNYSDKSHMPEFLWREQYHIILIALNRLSLYQIQTAIQMVCILEIHLKNDYNQNDIWQKLEILCIYILGIKIPKFIFHELFF